MCVLLCCFACMLFSCVFCFLKSFAWCIVWYSFDIMWIFHVCSKGKWKQILHLSSLVLTTPAVVQTYAKIDTGRDTKWHFKALLFLLRIWKNNTLTLLSYSKYISHYSLLNVTQFSVFLSFIFIQLCIYFFHVHYIAPSFISYTNDCQHWVRKASLRFIRKKKNPMDKQTHTNGNVLILWYINSIKDFPNSKEREEKENNFFSNPMVTK